MRAAAVSLAACGALGGRGVGEGDSETERDADDEAPVGVACGEADVLLVLLSSSPEQPVRPEVATRRAASTATGRVSR